jgi:MFS family permease
MTAAGAAAATPAVADATGATSIFVPDARHGILLIMGSWCTVMASGILAPVLPRIADHFAGTPNLALLIGFVATMPALAVALLAFPLGRIADRVGQRRVLLVGLAAYGIAGVVPFWLQSLHAIVVARFVVGIGEAAVMTASTTMIGLYFTGAARTRWLSAQVASANIMGVLMLFAGGYAGTLGWRTPFLAYMFVFLLLLPCWALLRLPQAAKPARRAAMSSTAGIRGAIATRCALIFVTSMAFFVVIIQTTFLLVERGASGSAQIGVGLGFAAAGIAIGATVAGALSGIPARTRLVASFIVMAIGFAAMSRVHGLVATVACAGFAGLGAGIVVPTLLSSLMAVVPTPILGTVIGFWTMSSFIGQFANPPIFLALRDLTGSLSNAYLAFGLMCAGCAAAILLLFERRRS